MQAIYRIYDTVEKRHRTDMFIDIEGQVREYTQKHHHFDGNGKETLTYTSIRVEDQKRYIKELCTGIYDKNKVLLYQNDVFAGRHPRYDSKDIINVYSLTDIDMYGCLTLSGGDRSEVGKYLCSIRYSSEDYEIIGHALRDSHLLEQ